MPSSARDRNLSAFEPLRLEDIPEDGLQFDEEAPEGWLAQAVAGGGLEFSPRALGRVRLDVLPTGDVARRPPIRIRGHVFAPLITDCVRCLETVPVDMKVDVDVTLFSADEAGEEADGVYEGDDVPLPNVAREAVALELPMNPVCEDEDACDARTAQLIENANAPARAAVSDAPQVDPRLAVLEQFKPKE